MTTADAADYGVDLEDPQYNAFTTWRRSRPFWAGVLTLLSAIWLWSVPFLFSVLTQGTLNLQAGGIAGISTLAMTPMMLVMALTIWFAPNYRVFAGIFTIICGLLSMVVSNFGGFVIGMLLAVFGGGLAFSWSPRLTDEQIAAQERAAQAYRDALNGDVPASAKTSLGAPAQAYGTGLETGFDKADDGAFAGVAAPARPKGVVAPTLPQNRAFPGETVPSSKAANASVPDFPALPGQPVPPLPGAQHPHQTAPAAPLADTLNQQRTASDSDSAANASRSVPPQDVVPPLPSAEDTPLGA